MHTQRDRHTDRETETERQRQRDRDRDGNRDSDTERQRDGRVERRIPFPRMYVDTDLLPVEQTSLRGGGRYFQRTVLQSNGV